MFKFSYAPPDGATTEFQISNRRFSDFLSTHCEFLNNVYRQGSVFSCGNEQLVTGAAGMAVACLPVGIAFDF